MRYDTQFVAIMFTLVIISWKPRARVEINCGHALPEAEVIRIRVRSSVRFP